MKREVIDLLNSQITEEFYSAYLYLNFSTIFTEAGYHGFANWFRVQAREELSHGMIIVEYLEANNESVKLAMIREPMTICEENDWIRCILDASLKHEKEITGMINSIVETADQADDLRTIRFLDWFVNEQAEEESNASDLIQEYDLFGDNPASLYLMDKVLAERRYEEPLALAKA